ncbi:GNAT family N-acetyltransferase [Geodermatophilus poikilotrophus]|uniref:Ribosomal-protein-alanine N-acetyltransferase n=1 Tax=Geodermatophilus poikilotrophus TaxID=1333667 RepID=A0A1I0EM43_9ACTN|nr:GNAT family protein [Geodermatophilus poikilotrophus]SET46529.1 ribosomal-protein-alanine N-acetyltransferase [Geodermatophilus poikilotrophus]
MVDPALRPGWPAHLVRGPVELHPPRRWDAEEWSRVRRANEDWLAQWEPTAAGSWAARHTPAAYRAMRRAVLRRAAMGMSLPFVVRVEGRLAGQVTIDNVVRGALRSGNLGYWIDRAVAGRGMASLAVALVCDHAFGPARLHRLQADIRPENARSRGLVHRLGFRHEGLLRRYLDIDGDWRDHDTFALLAEDVPGGVVARWESRLPR